MFSWRGQDVQNVATPPGIVATAQYGGKHHTVILCALCSDEPSMSDYYDFHFPMHLLTSSSLAVGCRRAVDALYLLQALKRCAASIRIIKACVAVRPAGRDCSLLLDVAWLVSTGAAKLMNPASQGGSRRVNAVACDLFVQCVLPPIAVQMRLFYIDEVG